MAFDEGLAQRIRDCLHQRRGISEKKMFGGLAFMANDYMFVGVTGEGLMEREARCISPTAECRHRRMQTNRGRGAA
jgi:hypothetical protein